MTDVIWLLDAVNVVLSVVNIVFIVFFSVTFVRESKTTHANYTSVGGGEIVSSGRIRSFRARRPYGLGRSSRVESYSTILSEEFLCGKEFFSNWYLNSSLGIWGVRITLGTVPRLNFRLGRVDFKVILFGLMRNLNPQNHTRPSTLSIPLPENSSSS